ncbi:MAG: hypothetical protein FVQ77_08095 [Cytophagales bacterium]|nr:hypothetical protein [Cytophagales bacterium]
MKTLRKIFTSLDIKYLMGSLVIFSFAMVWYSCNKDDLVDKFLTFDYSDSTSFTTPILEVKVDTIVTYPTKAKDEFGKNGADIKNIKKASLKALKLTITNSGRTFAFLDSVKIYLADAVLGNILLAGKNVTPADTNSNVLTLDTKGGDFIPYVNKDTLIMNPQLFTNRFIFDTLTFNVNYTFSVTADPLK